MRRYGKTANCEQEAATKPRGRRQGAVKLGEVVRELMDNRISRQQVDFASIDKLCRDVLPQGLLEHCSIAGISGGQLKLQVDSPVYMYELQLAGGELLEELKRRHPRVAIEKIKLVLA